MSEWITDRLPTAEDAIADRVIVWDDDKGPMLWMYGHVSIREPWMPIRCKPYVKPKRWTVRYDKQWAEFNLFDGELAVMTLDKELTIDAAQRIADIYNEVMP
jgi:hypothetical protein